MSTDSSKSDKRLVNVIYVGHVDNGKSTLQGRLFYDLGKIPQHLLDKMKKEAEEKGKASFEFAWFLDSLAEERERGVTVTLAYNDFETENTRFNCIDAPGHRDYLKNMITGASQADVAVIVLNVNAKSLQLQVKNHFKILAGFGVRNFIVAVNKMDEVEFSQQSYDAAMKLITKYMGRISPLAVIPTSALQGHNLINKSTVMTWYTGPTLIEALESVPSSPDMSVLPLRVPISETYTVPGVGQIIAGKVFSGEIHPNKKYILEPGGQEFEVKAVQSHHKSISMASAGENIGISIKGGTKLDVKRGSVVCGIGTGGKQSTKFVATLEIQSPDKATVMQILNIKDPTFVPKPFSFGVGYAPLLNYHAGQVQCKIIEILKVNGKPPESPFVGSKDVIQVVLETQKPIFIETTQFRNLSRILIRDVSQIVAIGVCNELL